MKVFVEGNNWSISKMFEEEGWELTTSVEECDLVCFEGGADVSPELYGEQNTHSFSDVVTDWKSIVLYNNAKRLDKPMIGICRGGQFLNVMAGGKMIQDYPGHAISGTHKLLFNPDDDFEHWDGVQVTSTHHQVMAVGKESEVFAIGSSPKEVEMAYHHNDRSFSFQPHPEYMKKGEPGRCLFFYTLSVVFGLKVS